MSTVFVEEELERLGASGSEADWVFFKSLAAVTALKQTPEGRYHYGHWWRGPWLYALVRHYKPRHILEVGTGRGYGAIAMAKAVEDAGLAALIWTVDQVPPSTRQSWAIDEGAGPSVRQLSINEAWEKHVPASLRRRIRFVTGDSAAVLKQWRSRNLPAVDMAFIDAGHDYWMVKHDLLCVLEIAAPHCTLIFDDYTPRRGYGVKQLVDGEIAPRLKPGSVNVVDMRAADYTRFKEEPAHLMAVVDGEALGASPAQLYSQAEQSRFMSLYALRAAVLRLIDKLRALIRPYFKR